MSGFDHSAVTMEIEKPACHVAFWRVSRADVVFESHFILGDTNVQQWRKQSCPQRHVFFSPSFLAFQFEVHNPGYSHYKSCLLDLRPQTGDRLCNLVSFSILLGFMGRCLTLQAGYLLATLKATFFFFFAYLSFGLTHIQRVHACRRARKERKKSVFSTVLKLYRSHRPFFFRKGHTFCTFWSTDSHPQLTHGHVNSHVHFFPPTHYVHPV